MRVSNFRRQRLLGDVWLCYAAKGGGPAPKENGWRRWLNVNGFGFNYGDRSIWVEFRRTS